MADTVSDENMQEGSPSNSQTSSRPPGKEGSLKHRILSRPTGGASSTDDSNSRSHSGTSTPVPSPGSSSHSDRVDLLNTTPKKRPRISDHNSDSSCSNTPHSELSKSTNSTPCRSPNPAPPHYPYQPNQFNRGSLIQLANGELKAIEAMSSEDFVKSAASSPNLRVEFTEIARVDRHIVHGQETIVVHFRVGNRNSDVAVEACEDHPFFVVGKGWSSTSPAATHARFGLQVAQLVAGDTCISLSYKEPDVTNAGESNVVGLEVSGRLLERNSRPMDTAAQPNMAVDPRIFALSGSDLASFRRWSAPEDDRFLDNLPK